MYAIELLDVSKRYGRRAALDSVSFAVPPGSALGLLGPNGAGKTTTLRLLLGFCRPDAGGLRLRGGDPALPASRAGVGWLPERLVLPPRARVTGFLRLQGELAGLSGAGLESEIERVLEKTGLADRADERLGGLSKGLSQRVGFAQALLGAPEVLLLDEPTTGLDPLGVRDARGWVQDVREQGCTVLVSSHLLSEVERSCDQLAILHQGRIAAQGRLEEVVEPSESLEDAFVRLVSS